ncbi:hypothetical protein Bhyg_17818 [Pseudolycoriella hygida]|uniref:Uncharacterized protein n=1 Tax=Pseudolycoriella hygida TaxID=35572 RepID=A0A9Q0RTR4_9DIPT|nr:hypothetical protein Bhyg_17818 [Pseudolycoriella hygida]
MNRSLLAVFAVLIVTVAYSDAYSTMATKRPPFRKNASSKRRIT